MAKTPDRFPGSREEDELILLENPDGDPVDPGGIRYVSGAFRLRDASGVFNPRGGSFDPEQHRLLDQLTHWLDESYFEEYTYSGWRVTNVVVWDSPAKNKKVREFQYSYSGSRVIQEIIIQYDDAGVEIERLTLDYTYLGSRVISVTCTRS